jgi:hypothetical protein
MSANWALSFTAHEINGNILCGELDNTSIKQSEV